MKFNLTKQSKQNFIELLEKNLGYEVTFTNENTVLIDNENQPDQVGEDFELEVNTPISNLTLLIIGNLMFEEIKPVEITTGNLLADPRGIKNRTIIFKYKDFDLFDDIHSKKDKLFLKKLKKLVVEKFNSLEAFDNSEFENLHPSNAKEFVSRLFSLFDEIENSR